MQLPLGRFLQKEPEAQSSETKEAGPVLNKPPSGVAQIWVSKMVVLVAQQEKER